MSPRRSELTPLRLAWLALALGGGVLALVPGGAGAAATPADLVARATLALWCLAETSVRRNWPALVTLPALALGMGCALPLYLFIRSRRIA